MMVAYSPSRNAQCFEDALSSLGPTSKSQGLLAQAVGRAQYMQTAGYTAPCFDIQVSCLATSARTLGFILPSACAMLDSAQSTCACQAACISG